MTPNSPSPRTHNNDESHLNTLAIVYYVAAGLLLLVGVLQFIAMGTMFHTVSSMQTDMHVQVSHSMNGGAIMTNGPRPAAQSAFSGIILFFFFIMALIGPLLLALSGRFLQQRRNYTFSFVVAILACLAFPLGTVLGVFTLIVLCRDSVKQLYNSRTF